MIEIDFKFREKLNNTIGGEHHTYCYQCGACVGDCPSARYSERFNPRMIVLMAIHGQEEELISEDSVIWECTNCYNCYERCPQDVRPVEVIVALKNMVTAGGVNPEKVSSMVNSVISTGRTAMVTGATNRIRGELGLKSIALVPIEELKKIT